MSTLKVAYNGTISIESKWRCGLVAKKTTDNRSDKKNGQGGRNDGDDPVTYVQGIVQGPTTGKTTVSFKYSLPSGKKIKKAVIWAKISSDTGISICNVNSNSFNQKKGSSKGATVKLSTTSGTLKATFKYKSAGRIYQNGNEQTSRCSFSNVYLLIEYAEDSKSSSGSKPKKEEGFAVPPQSVCIYDQSDKSTYMFDGVTKVQHVLALDIQEEPDKKKKDYVNNAKNEPDKLTIDVLMSDVYSGKGSIITKAQKLKNVQKDVKKSWTRSATAFNTLHWLKEERRKLTVITPQFVYTDMILSNVTVNHDDACPFGWEGQLTFQHAYKAKKATKKATKDNGTENKRIDPSVIAQTLGRDII